MKILFIVTLIYMIPMLARSENSAGGKQSLKKVPSAPSSAHSAPPSAPSSAPSSAAPSASTADKNSPKPNVPKSNILDFEADVIEGERAAPSLFVQMDIQAPKMETLVFQRKNFNDFHVIDKYRKPKYRSNEIKGK